MPRIYSRRIHIVSHQRAAKPEPPKPLKLMTPEERDKLVKLPVLQFQQRRWDWETRPEGSRL